MSWNSTEEIKRALYRVITGHSYESMFNDKMMQKGVLTCVLSQQPRFSV